MKPPVPRPWRTRSLRVSLVASLAFSLAHLAPSVALATPSFPSIIEKELTASSAPECAVCHVDGRVGRGTVNTPFGVAMRARGLVAFDEASLASALKAMASDRVDSNGDGKLDVDALKQGESPNGAAEEGTEVDPITPTYGCVGQVAPFGAPGFAMTLPVLLGLALVARRRRASATLTLGAVVASASLAACSSGAGLAKVGAAEMPREAPRMKPIRSTALSEDLRKLGLNPRALPRFAELEPRQVRGLMSTFTRSLGAACTDCHDANAASAPTRMKHLTIRMWDDMTRNLALEGGELYCDSCHQGQAVFLRREPREALSAYMSDSYTDKLKQAGAKDVECETCHGDPINPRFLKTW